MTRSRGPHDQSLQWGQPVPQEHGADGYAQQHYPQTGVHPQQGYAPPGAGQHPHDPHYASHGQAPVYQQPAPHAADPGQGYAPEPVSPPGQFGHEQFPAGADAAYYQQPTYAPQPYDVPPTQPPYGNGGELPGAPDPLAYADPSSGFADPQLRPTTHDQHVNPQTFDPAFGAPVAPDQQAYDLGNYMPAGAPELQRPAFGEPGYQPTTDWGVGLQDHHPGGGHANFDPAGAPQGSAVAPHADGYGDENDDDYEYEYEDEESGGGRKWLIAAALVAAIVVGGGFAFGYNLFFAETKREAGTPIIKADVTPAKIQPTDPGGQQFSHTDSKLLGKLGDGGQEATAAADSNGGRVKSVSTLVVGRDGRLIVPEPSADRAPSQVASAPQTNAAPASPEAATPVPGLTIVGGALDQNPAPPAALGASNVQPANVQQAPVQPSVPGIQQSAVVPAQPQQSTTVTIDGRRTKLPPLPVRSGLVRPQRTAAVLQQAATPGIASANVTPVVPQAQRRPAAPAAPPRANNPPVQAALAAAPAAGAANGYVAVLSTKRSRIDALTIFADLQQKYGAILSSKVPAVRRADLSSRGLGVMYRAVVGPPGSKQAAGQTCARLKAAGYTGCWVAPY